MSDLVIMKNQQVVTTSLQIAADFEKEHKHVMRDIRSLQTDVSNFGLMFLEGEERDSYNRPRKVFYLNRDGFSLLAMGFTGKKALAFKLKYIEAFNQMEQQIQAPQTVEDLIIMQANSMKQIRKEMTETKQEVSSMKEILSINSNEWRKKVNSILNRIANNMGGVEPHRSVVNMSYERLETRAHCDLNRRLENRQTKMAAKGLSKTSIQKLNKLDCISEDKRLIEIYLAVVREMAIQFGINAKELEELKVV